MKYCIVYDYKDKRVKSIPAKSNQYKYPLNDNIGPLTIGLRLYSSKEDADKAIKNKEFIPVTKALKIYNHYKEIDDYKEATNYINGEIEQLKSQMRSKGLFDSLNNIRENLFDADSNTKSSFNNLVKYFSEDKNKYYFIKRSKKD